MAIRMAIADKNERYIGRLLKGLEKYTDIRISVYGEEEKLKEDLASKHYDILLFDSAFCEGRIETGNTVLAIMLVDDDADIPGQYMEFGNKTYKYQRISRIYQQVIGLYAEVCKDMGTIMGQGGAAVVAFYSPVGGAGKTTLALATATRLAMQGSRVFYLNLEDFASEDCYLPQDGNHGMDKIAESMWEEKINFSMMVQGLWKAKSEGLYYLNHFDKPGDIYALTREDLERLLERLVNAALFDYIVIDMGISLEERTRGIFEAADKIVLVEKPDAMAIRKMECFLAQKHILDEYSGKMLRLLNFDMGQGSRISSGIPLAGKINAAQNPDSSQFISMLANDAGIVYLTQLL